MYRLMGGFFMSHRREIMSHIRANGSRFFASDGKEIVRLVCLKTFDLGSDSTGKIETTCLDDSDTKSYIPGLADPGDGSFGFDINKDNASHLKILDWAERRTELTIIVAEPGNETDLPKIENGELKLPNNRTFWKCVATLANPVWKFEADTLVNCTVTLQRKTKVIHLPPTA